MEECRVVFNKYDKRRRGYIDLYDLKKALEEIDIKFSHPYVFHKMVSE
jgi:Ca2+-binding EF-hand superfamily protein